MFGKIIRVIRSLHLGWVGLKCSVLEMQSSLSLSVKFVLCTNHCL